MGRGQCGWSGVSESEGGGEAGGQPAPRGLVSSWAVWGHCRALSTDGTASDFGGLRCSGCRGTRSAIGRPARRRLQNCWWGAQCLRAGWPQGRWEEGGGGKSGQALEFLKVDLTDSAVEWTEWAGSGERHRSLE